MDKYVYRVLRENEIVDKGLGEGLYSKNFDLNNFKCNGTFGEALDNITTHILNGNNTKTDFISCSTNFCLDLRKYGTEQLEYRPNLAVIDNHESSVVESKKYQYLVNLYEIVSNYANLIYKEEKYELIKDLEDICKNNEFLKNYYYKLSNIPEFFRWRIPAQMCIIAIRNLSLSDIDKFVIDASRDIYYDKVYSFFMQNGLIYNKNGNIKESYNQWESGTARKSSEVLVLNHIKRDDFKILNPLQYDILYALINNYSLFRFCIDDSMIQLFDIFCYENFNIIETALTEKEKILFKKMYYNRETIYKITDDLSSVKDIVNCKRNIISKCIIIINKYYKKNYFTNYITTLEDSIDFYNSPVVEVNNGKIMRKIKK